jgi:hypothetical protein
MEERTGRKDQERLPLELEQGSDGYRRGFKDGVRFATGYDREEEPWFTGCLILWLFIVFFIILGTIAWTGAGCDDGCRHRGDYWRH